MHSSGMRQHYLYNMCLFKSVGGIAFRWNAQYWHLCCRHFELIPFRFAQLHHFCIPAYTHQIPNGISSHFLIYSRSKYAYPKMGFL